MAVKLHLLPYCEQNGCQNENGWPVLQLVTAVNAGVESRQLFQDVLLELTPHVRHGALDLEVDHDRSHRLALELGGLVLDLSNKSLLLADTFDHGHVKRQVVRQNELESLADHGELRSEIEAEGGLQHLRQEWRPLEVVINELLEAAVTVDVAVEIIRQHGM